MSDIEKVDVERVEAEVVEPELKRGLWGWLKYFASYVPPVVWGVSFALYFVDGKNSLWSKLPLVAWLLYFIWPADLLWDFAPLVGWLDELGLLALLVAWYGKRLEPYRERAYRWLRGA